MFNLLFGLSGRLRRREFILWSIIVPLVLIMPPAIAVASTATNLETGLVEDLAASGMLLPFFGLILLSSYVSVALFWKRMNDVDEDRQRRMLAGFVRWGYAVMTVLNAAVIGLHIVASGDIEGSAAGFAIMALWGMACRLPPHLGPNGFGPDPRSGSSAAAFSALDVPSESILKLEAAMQRALAERNAHATAVLAPQLARAAKAAPAAPAARPSFGRRG